MRKLEKYGRKPLGKPEKLSDVKGNKLPTGIRTEIREIMQNTYFVIPKPENYQESYKRVDEIINMLISGNFEITPDYVEARSIAIVSGIILDELREGINL